jgi:hypothetical protein
MLLGCVPAGRGMKGRNFTRINPIAMANAKITATTSLPRAEGG